jgi:hypothetical protein
MRLGNWDCARARRHTGFTWLWPHRFSLPAIALIASGATAGAQSLPALAFLSYDPNRASSIVPGLFSLYSVPVDSLSPTQINVGDTEVEKKQAD